MASCQTSQWVSSSPYVVLTVTQSESTDTTATLSWTLQYVASSAAKTSVAKSYTVTINGSTVKSGTYDINGKTGTITIASGTQSITKTTSTQTISFGVSFEFNLTWSGEYKGTASASGSISVAAKTSYTISYNANGGSGTPSSQTKWYGTDITLSNTKPTRNGYTFQGWGTSSSTSTVSYSAGATYSEDKSITLYAVWTALTYTVSYNANGGSGAPSNQTKTHDVTLTLSSTKPNRTNYTFKGWGTSASSTTVSYAAGASYDKNAAITLYAVWALSYTKPKIGSISVYRCDSSGNSTESGTYAKVQFSWTTSLTVSSVVITWKKNGSSSSSSSTISSSGTSGTVSTVVGNNAIGVDSAYVFTMTVADSNGSSEVSRTLSGNVYTIDLKSGGTGVAIGKVSEIDERLEIGWHTIISNSKAIYGWNNSGNLRNVFEPFSSSNNTLIGYGNWSNGDGNVHLYGYDINVFSKAAGDNVSYRPYYRIGDTISNIWFYGAGFLTSSKTRVQFTIPLAKPIIGSGYTLSASSNNGFILRQDNNYTHGSNISDGVTTYTNPSSYSALYNGNNFIVITAVFDVTTNAVNNAPIGICWNGNISIS